MADLSDVSNALVDFITTAIYPTVGSNPTTGFPTKIFAGWPIAGTLEADLLAGTTSISVYPEPNMERVTTRNPREWHNQTAGTVTLTAIVSGLTITIGGTVTTGNYVTATVGKGAYSYAALQADTTATIASALAALINVDTPASASGSVITLASVMGGRIAATVAAPGTTIREVRRQQHGYQITIWAPTNDARVAAVQIIDPLLAAVDFLSLPDFSETWLTYRGQNDVDSKELQNLYRRDLFWWAEYGTTQVQTSYPITSVKATVTGLPPNSPDFTPLP